MSKRKILVTGGAGNIGSAMVRRLIKDGNSFVVVADNLSTGFIHKLPTEKNDDWLFVKSDVNVYHDIAQIMLGHQFDYVFHLAAVVGVKRTQENPISVLRDIDGIKNILELSKNTSVKRVFYASSSEVYGEPVSLPQHEHTTPLNSRVPYAVVKNLGECFCKSYHQEFGLNYTIYRYFNTYGPNQSTDFVLPRFLEAALKHKDITLYGDGSQTRTFTYVDDTIEASLACLYKEEVVNDVINIGNEAAISVADLARLILQMTGSRSKIVHLDPLKEGDMTRRQPENTKMKKLLNRPLVSLEEGIRKMMENKEFLASIGL